jgi:hypothetical protein
MSGFGVDLPANTTQVPGGFVAWTADAKALSLGPILKLMNYVQTGADTGLLTEMTPEMIAAAEKDPAYAATLYASSGLGTIERWFGEDKIVFLSYSITTGTPPISLAAIPRSNTERLKEIKGDPGQSGYPAFEDPLKPAWTDSASKAGIGTLGMLAIGVAVLGVGYFVYQGTKKGRR